MKSCPSDRFRDPFPKAAQPAHSLEILEARIAPAALVSSIVRAGGAAPDTAAGSVSYTVTFSEAVTGVDPMDFLVHTEGHAHANAAVAVTGSGTTYTVTASGLHGQGDVRLDLIDNNSITGASGPLGGAGAGNGSFQGAAYHLLQTYPKVDSITALGPTTTNAGSVSWTVTLSAPVTGVDANDFVLVKTGVSADPTLMVTGSGAAYTVTATGVSGPGTLGLRLVDDGTIKDAKGNPLRGTSPAFAPPADFAVGSRQTSVALVDVNGDGNPDLVSANYSSGTVSVLLGNGHGGFAAPMDFGTAPGAWSVAVADLNGDGKPDLVATSLPQSKVSVLLANSSGGFDPKMDFTVGSAPFNVAVADVNGDGRPDLVTANYGSTTVSVLLGTGSGAFGGKTDFNVGDSPRSVAVGDVNGDGKPDLVAANYHGDSVSVLLGDGSGSFATKMDYPTGGGPWSVAVADVNGDGKSDVVTANRAGNSVSVLQGNGSGAFAAKTDFAAGADPVSVKVSDLDGDGHLDLVVANRDGNAVSLLPSDGLGGFASPTALATADGPFSVAVGDVNGDGRPDVAAASGNSNSVSLLLSTGADFSGNAFLIPPLPKVSSIVPAGPASVTGASASWNVTFSTDVTGVNAADFAVLASGGAKTGILSVSGSGHDYVVTVNGLHGSGDLRLNLVDDDSIMGATAPLGGAGAANGSFQGDAIHLLQTFPKITSIAANGSTTTNAGSVSWTVTLSAPVTGVDATDFVLLKSGVNADAAVTVTGSGTTYTVTATGVLGLGTLGLQLVDDGTIKDANGNPLQGTPPPAFAPQASLVPGGKPFTVAMADVNGDGKPDLVTANYTGGSVSVFLGDGSGGFSAKTDFAVAGRPLAVAVADVNGDGKPDLLTTEYLGNTVSLLLGDGSGHFSPRTDITVGAGPDFVAAADVNGDGHPDLVTVNYGSASVSVLLGNGKGGFGVRTDFATGSHPNRVAVADLNGDGRPDLSVVNIGNNSVSVLLGNGNGSFAAKSDFAVGDRPYAVAVADLNGDGKPDLVAANQSEDTVSVLLGDGSGGFGPKTSFATGRGPISAELSDFNGDGKLDLVTANFASDTVSVLLGNGSGGFGAPTDLLLRVGAHATAVGDVNGDGKPDLVVAKYDDSAVTVLLNAGTGTFTGTTYNVFLPVPVVTSIAPAGPGQITGGSASWTVSFNTAVTGVDLADFAVQTTGGAKSGTISVTGSGQVYTVTVDGLHGSGDVQLNLVDNDSISNSTAVLGGAGSSNGSFQGGAVHLLQTFPKVTSITPNGGPATDASSVSWTVTLSTPVIGVDAADFALIKSGVSANAAVMVSGSGTTYIVTATGVSGQGTLALQLIDNGTIKDLNGNPLQGTMPPAYTQSSVDGGSRPAAVAVADVNGDGALDIITAAYGSNALSVVLGDGHGGFGAKAVFDLGQKPSAIAVADLNGDGHLDLVTTEYQGGKVDVLLGNGTGQFGAPQKFLVSGQPIAVAVADLNGDGKPDLVVASYGGDKVNVLLGNGSGSFAGETDYATGSRPNSVAVADLNGDGRLDLAISNVGSDSVSVLLGDGHGAFAAKKDFTAGIRPYSVAVADVNGDGRPDLVAVNQEDSTASVLLGVLLADGSRSFAAKTDFATGRGPDSVTVGDVNGDGRLDLVTTNFAIGTVSVLLGDGSGGFAARTDFTPGTGSIFAAFGDLNGDGRLDLVTADVDDNDVSVLLNSAGGSFIGDTVSILPAPAISIADTSVLEGNTGTPHATFTVTLSHASSLPVTVDYATANGTAVAPGDYTTLHGTVTFAAGETSKTIDVAIRPDTLFEAGANETFQIQLSHPTNATFFNSQAVGTILSDDGVPAQTITLDAKHPFVFFDRNHDKVTVKLTGTGTGTLILDGGVLDGADISEIHLANAAKSALSIAVTKDLATGDGLVRLGELTVEGALLSFSAPAADLTVGGLRANGPVKTITAHALLAGEIVSGGSAADTLALTVGTLGAGAPFLIATPQTISALKAVSVGAGQIGAAALTSIAVSAGSFAADLTTDGAIGAITVKGGSLSGHLTAAKFGAVSVTGGSFSGSLTSTAPAASLGKAKALTSLAVTTGNLTGDVNLLGAGGAITVKTGGLSGHLTAASFGAVAVTGGDFSGSLTSLTPRATLGATKALTSLTVTDGNLTGDIRLRGASGAITVKSKPALGRGDLSGASIVASAIASLTVGRDFISSIVLAGADLGADYAFGGGDTFAAGTIGAVKIGRNVSGAGSIIGAGFVNVDGILKSVDDAITGGVASIIASLNVTGTAAPESYFAAGKFKTAPKIAGSVVPLAGDGRFKVG